LRCDHHRPRPIDKSSASIRSAAPPREDWIKKRSLSGGEEAPARLRERSSGRRLLGSRTHKLHRLGIATIRPFEVSVTFWNYSTKHSPETITLSTPVRPSLRGIQQSMRVTAKLSAECRPASAEAAPTNAPCAQAAQLPYHAQAWRDGGAPPASKNEPVIGKAKFKFPRSNFGRGPHALSGTSLLALNHAAT
jgi:hypothetical protein